MSSIQSTLIRFLLKRSNLWNQSLEEIRRTMGELKSTGIPGGIELKKVELNGIPSEVMTNPGFGNKAILYFHGGGFCMGIYHSNRDFVARLAKESRTTVYLPDYKLAPENPFPSALEDAIEAYRGIISIGYRTEDIIIIGDSSGCALALSALIQLKEYGVGLPASIVCITPVFDMAGTGDSFISMAEKDPFRLKDPLGITKNYVGEHDSKSPLISPLYGAFDGFPPVLIHAAEWDVFYSDAVRFADKLKTYGIEVELKVWKQMWHVFHMQDKIVPEARKAIFEICEFMKETNNSSS